VARFTGIHCLAGDCLQSSRRGNGMMICVPLVHCYAIPAGQRTTAHQHRMGVVSIVAQSGTQYEPTWKLPFLSGTKYPVRQRIMPSPRVFQPAETGAHSAQGIQNQRRRKTGRIPFSVIAAYSPVRQRNTLKCSTIQNANTAQKRDAVARRVRKALENETRRRLEN